LPARRIESHVTIVVHRLESVDGITMQEDVSAFSDYHEGRYAGESLEEHVRVDSYTEAFGKMILIVRGHISSEEAKYAISLWKMFESGSARPYASGVTS